MADLVVVQHDLIRARLLLVAVTCFCPALRIIVVHFVKE